MNIQGMGSPHAFPTQRGQGRAGAGVGSSSKLQEQPALPVEKPTTARIENNQGQANGVIQKLQEGHFQGVASVRLQINFHYQLQDVNTQKATQALESGSNELVAGLGEKVSELGASFPENSGGLNFGEEADRLMLSFESKVEGLFAFSDGGVSDPAGILAGIDDAFQDFFNSLSQWALPASSEPVADDTIADTIAETAVADDAVAETAVADDAVTEGAVADDVAPEIALAEDTLPETAIAEDGAEPSVTSEVGEAGGEEDVAIGVDDGSTVQEPLPVATSDMEGTQEVVTFADGLQDLQTWFDSQLESLRTTMDELLSMPPLGEPRGNGVAYSRFLAIYSELNGYGGDGSEQAGAVNGGGLNTAA